MKKEGWDLLKEYKNKLPNLKYNPNNSNLQTFDYECFNFDVSRKAKKRTAQK